MRKHPILWFLLLALLIALILLPLALYRPKPKYPFQDCFQLPPSATPQRAVWVCPKN